MGDSLEEASIDKGYCEDRVTSGGGVVHVGGGCGPDIVALFHEVENLLVVDDQMLGEVLDVRSGGLGLPDFERELLRLLLEQILHFLIVDFEVANLEKGKQGLGRNRHFRARK